MELVSSYISDEEMESQVNQKKAEKKDSENKDSVKDADGIDIIFEKAAVKTQKPTNDEIECICLDDSDSDNIEVASSSEPSKNITAFPTINKEESKKVDYLNLESSDTDDDEQERIQNSVNNLLSSAAILNDIECGPQKPMPSLDISITLPSCSDNAHVSKKRSISPPILVIKDQDNKNISPPSLPVDITLPSCTDNVPVAKNRSISPPILVIKDQDIKNISTASLPVEIFVDKISSHENLSNKKPKLDLPPSTDDKNVTEDAVEDLQSRIRMYRKDDRIVAAYKKKGASYIPSTLSHTITAHKKSISTLSWSAVPYSHLFLSSSLDCSVKVWDIYSQNKPIQTLKFPFGVRAAKWSKSGEQIIAGGFGKQVHVIDVLSGKTHMTYKFNNHVSSIAVHPFIEDVILCGTKNAIVAYDLRVEGELPVRAFLSKCGEVLDMVFLNKNEFACSSSVVSYDSADRTIMVWDFNSGAIMSNQIFLERYTCPSLKVNPFDSSFVAQTNGDYIAAFSSQRPYKIKKKRYMGHKVSGFGIECDVSPDGQYVASGDAQGDVYFYNYADTEVVNKLTVKPDVATNKLKWHPVLSSTMAVATWDGQIHVWK